MSDHSKSTVNNGEVVLVGLRVALLATVSALVGVLGYVVWKMISG